MVTITKKCFSICTQQKAQPFFDGWLKKKLLPLGGERFLAYDRVLASLSNILVRKDGLFIQWTRRDILPSCPCYARSFCQALSHPSAHGRVRVFRSSVTTGAIAGKGEL